MREVTEAAKFPLVTFKGVTRVPPPASYPATVQVSLHGELEFHGQKRKESLPTTITFAAPGQMHVVSRFDVSLDAYKVERPSLLMMPVDDACKMVVDLQLVAAEAAPAAPAAPGSGK
jgi:polyisoprenoid-binding protein YceI